MTSMLKHRTHVLAIPMGVRMIGSGRYLKASLAALAATVLLAGPANAEKPLMVHVVETAPADGSFVCGGVVLTVASGTQTEKVHAVAVNGVVHYNLVRSYSDVTVVGSDGLLHKVAASVHATVLLPEGSDEPISVREVIQVTFGGLGYLHEVLVINGNNETSTVTGTCDYN